MQISYEKELPVFMKKMENLLEANDNGSEYFVGTEVRYVCVWQSIILRNLARVCLFTNT